MGRGRFGPWPVRSKKADQSPYGVFDMAGNLLEWTADWYDERAYHWAPFVNPAGPIKGEERVIRGGSYVDETPRLLRVYQRAGYDPNRRRKYIGFRCAFSKHTPKPSKAPARPTKPVADAED